MAEPVKGIPLAEFIANAPLYVWRAVAIEVLTSPSDLKYEYVFVPSIIQRECPKCGPGMNWSLNQSNRGMGGNLVAHDWHFNCKNCGERFGVWMRWGRNPQGVVMFGKDR